VSDAFFLFDCSTYSSTLKMEATSSSEWLVNFYNTTGCHVQINNVFELSHNLYLMYCGPKFKLEGGGINEIGNWNPGLVQFLVNVEAAYKMSSSNSYMISSLRRTKHQIKFNIWYVHSFEYRALFFSFLCKILYYALYFTILKLKDENYPTSSFKICELLLIMLVLLNRRGR
jgi:hypothetical protein